MHATNVIQSGVNVRLRRRHEGLTVLAEERLREILRRTSPSEPWVDAQFVEVRRPDERGNILVRRIHEPGVFPPGGLKTAMVRCAICGIFTPPPAMEHGQCLDHANHDSWGPSPSAHAIRMLQYYNLRLPEDELPPESTEGLCREIEEHLQNSSSSHG